MLTLTRGFLDTIARFSAVLHSWTIDPLTMKFLETISEDRPRFPDWRSVNEDYELAAFEEMMVSDAILGTLDSVLTIDHAERTFSRYFSTAAVVLWAEELKLASTSSSEEAIMRRVLSSPPGEGVCSLCLYIAQDILMVKELVDEIEISRALTPRLPFTEEETATLMKIVKRESRLRLALCLAFSLGRLSSEFDVVLNIHDLEYGLYLIIGSYVASNDPAKNDRIANDLNLVVKALVISR